LALIEITDQIRQEIENKNITIGLYLDLTKAFDLVNHEILIEKLEMYGIRGTALEVVKSYLSNRSQYTKTGAVKSTINKITCGVPQGSVLGPLFFLVYVNDMQNCTSAKLRLFADDTNIFISEKNPLALKHKMEQCMKSINTWLNANKLLLSPSKTNFSIFMPANMQIPACLNSINVNGMTIKRTTTCRYLGILLDDRLKFNDHITQLSKELVKTIQAFKIIRNWIPISQKLQMYNAYFHSKLQYGLEIYGSAAKRYLGQIDVLQHRALKTLFNLDPRTPSKQLLNRFKVLSVHDLYNLKISKFMYRHRVNKLPEIFSHYFKQLESCHYPNTRNRHKLQIPRMRTETGKKTIRYTGVKIWNHLLSELKYNIPDHSEAVFVKRTKQLYLSQYV
jgi:hypothetical protein